MQISPSLLSSRRLWQLAWAFLLPAGLFHAAEVEDPIAVFAATFNGYARTRLPDKSFKPEAYTFGEGGCWTRPVKDKGMEEMTFLRVAKAVAAPLARQNYRPAPTSAEAELLILVYWGATEGSQGNSDPTGAIDRFGSASSGLAFARDADAADKSTAASPATAAAESAYDDALTAMLMGNALRDRSDYRNARILGYTEALDRAKFAAHMSFAQDIMSEVANNRYYVVLQAYDFKTAVKERKLKPLWTARISMDESGNRFDESLNKMLRTATRYLGQDSNGLHREANHETHVELGPMEVIETLPALPTPPAK